MQPVDCAPPPSGLDARDSDIMHGMAFSSIGLLPQLWTEDDREEVALNTDGAYDMCAQRDSVTQIMEMLMWRANGGCRVEDYGLSGATDLLVKSDSTALAAPGLDGCKVLVDYPERRHVSKHVKDIELDYKLRTGSPVVVHGYAAESLARDAGLNAGERTGRAFIADATYPLSSSKIGSALTSLRTLASFSQAMGGDTRGLYSNFEAMWGVPIPAGGLSNIMDSVGDPTVRRAMLDDKHYHASLTHYSKSGVAKIFMAPMTSDSINRETPIPWSKLRQSTRSIAILNIQADEYLLRSWRDTGQLPKIGFDIIRRSLVSGRPSVRLSSALAPLQYVPNTEPDEITKNLAEERASVLKTMYSWYRDFTERTAYNLAVRDEQRRGLVDTEDELKLSSFISVPRSRIEVITLPPALAMSSEMFEPTYDIQPAVGSRSSALIATNFAGLRGDVHPVLSQFSTILKMLLTAECNRPKTFSTQVKIMQRLKSPQDLAASSYRDYWRDAERYRDKSVRSLMKEIVGPKRYNEVLRVYSLTGGATYQRDCHNGFIQFIRRCGVSRSQLPEDPNDALHYLTEVPSQYLMCAWIRRACGMVATAMSGNWFAMPYEGKTLTFSRAVYDFLLGRVKYWKAYYHQRSEFEAEKALKLVRRVRQERRHEVFQMLVKYQAAATTFKRIKVVRTEDRVAIQLTASAGKQVLIDMYNNRHDSIAKRKLRTRPSKRVQRARNIAASSSLSWRALTPSTTNHRAHASVESQAGELEEKYTHPWGPKLDLSALSIGEVLIKLESLDASLWTVNPVTLWDYCKKQVELVVVEGREVVGSQMKALLDINQSEDEPPDLIEQLTIKLQNHPELKIYSAVALPLLQLEERKHAPAEPVVVTQDIAQAGSNMTASDFDEWDDDDDGSSWMISNVNRGTVPTQQVAHYPTLRQLFTHVFGDAPPRWRATFRVPDEMSLDDSVVSMPAPLNVELDKMDSVKERMHLALLAPPDVARDSRDVVGRGL